MTAPEPAHSTDATLAARATLPDDLFARLLGGSVRHGAFPDDARGAPRVVLNRRAVLRRCEPGSPDRPCAVRDLSVSGVGLLVDRRMEPGQPFVLVLRDPAGVPAALPCVAVRCRDAGTDGRRFVVGATFSKDLPRPAMTAAAPRRADDHRRPQSVSPRAAAGPAPGPAAAEVERIRAAMFGS